jgi:hypothetical protein
MVRVRMLNGNRSDLSMKRLDKISFHFICNLICHPPPGFRTQTYDCLPRYSRPRAFAQSPHQLLEHDTRIVSLSPVFVRPAMDTGTADILAGVLIVEALSLDPMRYARDVSGLHAH